MAGRKGRSGGHNRLSREEHWQRGTWNVTRMGPRPVSWPPVTAGATAVQPTAEQAPESIVAGLGAPGRDFVMRTWREYDGWSTAEETLLGMAGQLRDDVATATDARGRRMSVKAFAAIVSQLGLGRHQ